MLLNVLSPICDGDAPYLVYDVDVENTEGSTATITFVNPSGGNVVYTDLPLSGTILWPGAAVDGSGAPTDWPGWAFVGGEWVEDSSDAWLRNPITVTIEVNPTASATVSYPPATPSCSANPPGREDPPPPSSGEARLPNTGTETLTYAGIAGGLVVLGGLTVAAVRRRAHQG
ncbi:LPXTG-motif cell wall anchor domain protein [Beutenbergia cavernae DSM 12333]|uniref:LPXTG-motif cell wall anchor domain protein n=2 Tax=Beutenbergia TaxID=84756 RepID=C5BX43_BEUC1|nr:LPXTG-motif cell wall anchor domain protein [Beutenbergia cavernae DSM 12333]